MKGSEFEHFLFAHYELEDYNKYDKYKFNKLPSSRPNPLMIAAKHGNDICVGMILDDGAEIDQLDNYEFSALHYATCYRRTSTVLLLLRRGADPNIGGFHSETPLQLTTCSDMYDIMRLLLDAGANTNNVILTLPTKRTKEIFDEYKNKKKSLDSQKYSSHTPTSSAGKTSERCGFTCTPNCRRLSS